MRNTDREIVAALFEIMEKYDERRAQWVRIYGNDEGFDAWFTRNVIGPRTDTREPARYRCECGWEGKGSDRRHEHHGDEHEGWTCPDCDAYLSERHRIDRQEVTS